MARVGRKRKAGRRTASGQLAREHVNYAALAALQPHRRDLPLEVRLSQDATTEIGRLFLWKRITEEQYLAGQEYERRIGAYRATIAGPHGLVGITGWSGCNPDVCRRNGNECECSRRAHAYQELSDVINQQGRRVELVTNRIVGSGEKVTYLELPLLRMGLGALAGHLRLTERGKRAYARNAQSTIDY
jgi:hypothetical protein